MTKAQLKRHVRVLFNKKMDKLDELKGKKCTEIIESVIDEKVKKFNIRVAADVDLKKEFSSDEYKHLYWSKLDILTELQNQDTSDLKSEIRRYLYTKNIKEIAEMEKKYDDKIEKLNKLKIDILSNIDVLPLKKAKAYVKDLGIGIIEEEKVKHELLVPIKAEYVKDMLKEEE